ncbi:PREDICTED: lysosome membrane protein 2-like [Amphimedon queenslandica]|uniref:Uncharacterized protein n=2 Tax=Amphimedon queenslandica TaxID=400682 RepID=A0AAN0IRN4_AMPQE|nr:PREDICTED: lysosome membrane protein 2-like [Amphimedon queenslandica]|eukprot:XP_011408057.2 PREDICTED: lysosome membrane protein 2-like [Amphimedon queenslandica]
MIKEVDKFIAKQVSLTKGSAATDQWSKPGAAVYMSFYMFNLTNKDEFLNGEKATIEEIGPFVYNESKTKYNLRWNSDETILEYFENTSYIFNKEKSNGLDPSHVNITTINLPLIGFLLQFEKLIKMSATFPPPINTIVKDLIETIITELSKDFNEKLIMTRPVSEILWGYEDPFLKFVADLLANVTFLDLTKDLNGGFFQLEHQTDTAGPNMVYTGKGSPQTTAQYLMYDGKTSITGWGTPYAQMINGTEALLFHPGVSRTDVLDVYVDELFRSGYFTYYKDITEFDIKMYQFRLPQTELQKAYQDKGFYMNGPDGVLNLTAVFPLNVPIFVSKPHFLDADEYYTNDINGPPSNRDKHDSFLNVEPITGAVLHAAKRLQINIQLKQYEDIPDLSHLPINTTYLPLLWVEETGSLNESIASTFRDTVYKPINTIQISAITVASVSGQYTNNILLAY